MRSNRVAAGLLLAAGFSAVAVAGEGEAGRVLFAAKCAMCHTAQNGAGHAAGPNLFGVVGRGIAAAPGYDYSDGMRVRAAAYWDAAALDRFLARPQAFLPGTRMLFPGLADARARSELIAFLAALR